MIKVCACVQTVATPVFLFYFFLSVTTTSRACPTALQKFHVATSISALMPHMHHIYITHGYCTHIHIHKVACLFSSPSRGHKENRNMLDVSTFVVLCCCSWLKSRVCQTVHLYSNANGSSRSKCQFCKQSQTISEVSSVTAEWSPYLF